MPTVAEIVAEELRAAEARIAERLSALLGGAVPRPVEASAGARTPSRPPRVERRFKGRVRTRLTPEEVEEGRRKVLAAVKAGAHTAGDVQEATGLDRHRATYALNGLRTEGELRRRGKGRAAKYYVA